MTKHTFYVSPEGDDGWTGRKGEKAGSDGPFRSLVAAQAAVRAARAASKDAMSMEIVLRGGTYHLESPIAFGSEDSGQPRAKDYWTTPMDERLAVTQPVVWKAYPGETPVLSGGRRLNGNWKETTVNGVAALMLSLPEVKEDGRNFTQLWINGVRRERPQVCGDGFLKVRKSFAPPTSRKLSNLTAGSTQFGFYPGDLSAKWKNISDIEVRFFAWWVAPRVKLTSIDEANGIAFLDRNSLVRLEWAKHGALDDGVDYRLENVFEALRNPGEWYLDRAEGRLYVIPLPGENLDEAEVIFPALETVVLVDEAHDIRFEGITFAHTAWTPPADYADSIQAAWETPGMVRIARSERCVFSRCSFVHAGAYGVEISGNSAEIELERCEVRDLGAGGIKIWHGCRFNRISDCEISGGGRIHAAGVGILVGRSTGNLIEHNHIHDFFYTGISLGWEWGYAESECYGNVVEWNHIHDIGRGVLSDMGGIYLLGRATGTRLRFNHIHDISCRRYGGWCIYLDEGSTHVLVESNLCYRANKTAFNQHFGKANVIRNNIFAFGGEAVVSYGKPEIHLGLIFERNIFLAGKTPILTQFTSERWMLQQTRFERNLYWSANGEVSFERGALEMFGTSPFPDGFGKAPFHPLVSGAITHFVSSSGNADAPEGNRLQVERGEAVLKISGTFLRPPSAVVGLDSVFDAPLWNREHFEIFLKPVPSSQSVIQIGISSDGATETICHGSSIDSLAEWHATTQPQEGSWQLQLEIPLAKWTAGLGRQPDTEWRFFAGFGMLSGSADWAAWQERGHDPNGVVADPLFVDPGQGDFRLQSSSPAFKLGFVPFDVNVAGPRQA